MAGTVREVPFVPTPGAAVGETDIDVSAAVYTGYIALLTIAPVGGIPLERVQVFIDLDKATTGFAATQTTQTVQMRVERKIDGTNWRADSDTETAALAGDNADGLMVEFDLGIVGSTQQARIVVKVSAENGDIEFPYCVTYKGLPPTITAVAA